MASMCGCIGQRMLEMEGPGMGIRLMNVVKEAAEEEAEDIWRGGGR